MRLIQGIVDTCPACKEWRRRGNRTIATSSTVWKFNDKVKHDLLFVEAQRIVPLRENEKGSATLIRRTGPIALAVNREQFHASQEQYTNDLTTLASNVIDNAEEDITDTSIRVPAVPQRCLAARDRRLHTVYSSTNPSIERHHHTAEQPS